MIMDPEKTTTTVGDDFPREQARLRELIAVYRGLPGGVGTFVALMIEGVLCSADEAAMSGDLVAIIQSYNEMRGCE